MREWYSDGRRGIAGKQEARVKMENIEFRSKGRREFSLLDFAS